MAVTLTDNAVKRVQTMLAKRGKGLGIRFFTRKSGCTGFSQEVDYADDICADDVVFETQGVKVVVSRKDLDYLDGTLIDYAKESLLNEGFAFANPNVKDACGCGESVSFK